MFWRGNDPFGAQSRSAGPRPGPRPGARLPPPRRPGTAPSPAPAQPWRPGHSPRPRPPPSSAFPLVKPWWRRGGGRDHAGACASEGGCGDVSGYWVVAD